MESYDEALTHGLKYFGISRPETDQNLILDALYEFQNCIGIISRTRNWGIEPIIGLIKTNYQEVISGGVPSNPHEAIIK